MSKSQISGPEWRELRLAKGWTQTEAASIAGVSSPSVISNVERGLPPGPTVDRKLREVLCAPAVDGPVPVPVPAPAEEVA